MPVRPVLRLARAVVFATVCTALAAAGHTMAAHAPVSPVAMAGGLAVLVLAGLALTGVERSLPTITGCLVGGQFMLHVLFAAARHGQDAGHDPHVAVPSHAAGGGTLAMTLAHLGAAVVAAWWLRRGERAVWGLARRIAAALARPALALLAEPEPPYRGPGVAPEAAHAARPSRTALRHVLTRRGPPSPMTALA